MTTQTTAAPKPAQVDALVREYAEAQAAVLPWKEGQKAAQETADEVKARLIAMVQTHGAKHAEKSLRIAGLHSKATITIGSRMTVDEKAVDTLREYLDKQEVPGLAERFFRTHVTYSLVEGPNDVLKTLDLATRIRNRIAGLLALCFQIVTNAPSLKIELVTPEKP